MSVVTETPVDTLAHIKEPRDVDQLESSNCHDKDSTDVDPLAATTESKLEGAGDEEEKLEIIRQVEFYFSDANLPFDKFMFLQTSPHLDPIKAPKLSPEAKQKAEAYGPGCSPVLLQTVASFKRMRPFSSKFPTSKLAQILQTSQTEPKLIEVITEQLDGRPTFYVRRVLKLEESSRVGVSDHCVYVKGFLSDEELEKGEPENIQIRLEKWAKQWGPIGLLRMRREADANGPPKAKKKAIRKWKNSVFVEYRDPSSAERLVQEFKQESGKPQFDGRELSSIMFKVDYVTMKANEKGLPVPKMTGKPPRGNPSGSVGGNNSTFNAFKELEAIQAGRKQYAGVYTSSKARDPMELEYEGNTLHVNKDGTLKDTAELKSYRPNLALGFELQGDAPTNHMEARVKFLDLKKDLSEGDLVCNYVFLAHKEVKGMVGFNQPISDEQLALIQSKSIKSGGRSVSFTRPTDEECKQFHLECAAYQAKSKFCPKDQEHRKGNEGRHGGHRGDRSNRGHGRNNQRGGRGGGRNAGKDGNEKNETETGDENKNNAPNAGNKRDAEGNVISTNGGTVKSATDNSIPEIGRAEKKPKTTA